MMEEDGIPEFDLINPTESHMMLREMVRDFVDKKVESQSLKHDREEKFNIELFRELGGLGLLGLTVSEIYGGSELDPVSAVIVHEELASSDPAFTLSYLAHSMLTANNLSLNGSDKQKQRYLPGLCSGELIGCMAMSEPDYGTDVMGMKTTAKLNSDGNWEINGNKMWITNGSIDEEGTPADLVWLYAKTGENEKGRAEISSFLIERGMQGYSVGQKIYDKAGMRASNTAELVFENCIVPPENLVGSVGGSILHMMRNLELERIALAAMSLGIARRSLHEMNKYATERTSFGKPIREYGQIQRHIAESYAEYKAMQAYVYNTARLINLESGGYRLDTDGVKIFATTAAKNIADRAIQVMGGYGYVGEYVVERLWRDSKLLEIGGGTIEAHQKNMTKELFNNPEFIFK
jgi:isovaleryl-CoA dehydrogenase